MSRYSHPPPSLDFFQHSPTSALDSKPAVFGNPDEDMNLMGDDKMLDANATQDVHALYDPRRSSLDHSHHHQPHPHQQPHQQRPAEAFSRRDSVWSDVAQHSQDAQSQHPSQLSTPLFEHVGNPFVRLDTTQTPTFASPHQQQQQQQAQQSWPLSAGSGSCTPTPVREQFAPDYDGAAAAAAHNPLSAGGMAYPPMPYRPGSTFAPQSSLPMSPQTSQGWPSAASDAPEPQSKPGGGNASTTFRASNGSTLHLRRDGIRKKNARFDIPAERTLGTIDFLISQTTDEEEIKELKQQKRLLRNRQAALDSRQRKKVHTEQLEEDKRRSSSLIKELQDALQEMKLRESELVREKTELFDRQQQLHQFVEQLHMEKEELIRTHTLETGELRKKNNILREHVDKLELNAASSSAPSAFRSDLGDYENINMGNAPWDDFCLVNEFPLGAETNQPVARSPTPTPQNALLAVPKKSDKPGERQASNNNNNQSDQSFSWNAFYMCLLFGAFIASNSSSMSTPAIPPLSEEYRAESANVLKAVLESAGPSDQSQSVSHNAPSTGLSSATTSLPATISGAEMAQMTADPNASQGVGVTNLDSMHHDLVAPTRQQEHEQAFALTTEQYKALTTMEDDGVEDEQSKAAPPSNLQQAYTAMRNNAAQNRPSLKGSQDIYSRSLLWDRVPDKVVRDFRRMVKECGVDAIKGTEDPNDMCS